MADDHFCEDLLRLYPDSNPQYQQQLRELNDRLSVDNDNRSNLTVKVYSCYYCKLLFDHPSKLKRHQRNSCTFPCRQCDRHFDSAENLFKHSNIDHTTYQTGSGNTDSNSHTTIKHKSVDKSALLGIARARFIYPNEDNGEKYDLLAFLSGIKHEVKTHLQEMCDELGHIKWYMNCLVQMIKPNGGEGGNDLKNNAHFISKTSNLVDRANIDDEHDINVTYQKIFKSFDEYIRNGSGWSLDHIKHIEINTAKYKPLGGGSYIPLPRTLAATRALLNIRNLDEKCFVYAIIASIHPTCSGDPSKVHHYIPYEHELNMEGIQLPVAPSFVSKFERQNNISVMVLGFEEGEFFPLHVTGLREAHHEVDLLYLKSGNKSHWCLITDLNRLLYRTKCLGRSHKYCRFCLSGFTSEHTLEKHIKYCSKFEAQHVTYPTKGVDDILTFQDHAKQLQTSFVIYADMETFCEPMVTEEPEDNRTSTTKLTKLIPCGYGYQVVCIDDRYTQPPKIYRGENVSEHFLHSLLDENKRIKAILNNPEPLCMTVEDEEDFQSSTHCHICMEEFTDSTIRVRDHAHVSGKFRGASCRDCNLNFKEHTFVPVIFHNLKQFDAHLICSSIGIFKSEEIGCIATNAEKYISFNLSNLRFIDSYQFLNCSLEELVSSMSKENPKETFKHFTKEFDDDKRIALLLKKGTYPYEYIDNAARFNETELPSIDKFYSNLSEKTISQTEYEHAQRVWNQMNIKNIGEYHDLYLKTDVLLLADVFQTFRKKWITNYSLDPANYYTLPGLSWQSALKMTGVRLELLTDPTMWLFFEQSIRGGLTMVSCRHAKANNPYLSNYDPALPTSYLMYVDANNLYGLSMSMPLAVGKFQWLSEEEINDFNVLNVSNNADIGYVIECDLDYPDNLHDLHNDFPLAVEKGVITNEMLSPHSRHLYEQANDDGKEYQPSTKLLATLKDKKHYILHYVNLKLYLKLGLVLKKIHNIVSFEQRPWLKQYIDFNTEMRKKATSNFEQKLFKNGNNAIFGKSMESLRKHINFSLCHRWDKFQKLTAKSSFKSFKIFNDHLCGVLQTKTKIFFNKPIYLGQMILDLSKAHMVDYYYNHMKKLYKENVTLCYTDTDSFIMHVRTDDIYRDMSLNSELYDFSNYPADHPLYTKDRKSIIGLFKDECKSIQMVEYIGLRAKMYSFITADDKETVVAKGIKTRNVRFEQYKNTLFNCSPLLSHMYTLRSFNHQIHMVKVVKSGLSPYDDKRHLLDDNVHSLAYFHRKLKEKH
ncbi:uncharacterized protein [Mytilus edulis]|uniref:uncharacterized protein n=1 Tax=Mytilus edulis TaxID=6550 RepID=UPI0039EF5CC7